VRRWPACSSRRSRAIRSLSISLSLSHTHTHTHSHSHTHTLTHSHTHTLTHSHTHTLTHSHTHTLTHSERQREPNPSRLAGRASVHRAAPSLLEPHPPLAPGPRRHGRRGYGLTRNPKPETRNPKPETRDAKTENRKPKPETRNPKPETLPLIPKPEIRATEDRQDRVSRWRHKGGAKPSRRAWCSWRPRSG